MSSSGWGGIAVSAGIESLGLPGLIRFARRRIILHAALYAPFARAPEYGEAFHEALSRPGFHGLDVILFMPDGCPEWSTSFAQVLRCGMPEKDFAAECAASERFIRDLERRFPDRVRVHVLRAFPCFPAVIVDDTVLCGQYARCPVLAPEGFWLRVETDVERVLNKARTTGPDEGASAEERAVYRVVYECFQALNEKGH